MTARRSALLGSLCALPFVLMNFVVALRVEPFYANLGSVPVIRNSPVTPLLLLLLFPVGAFVAMRPLFAGGKKSGYAINILVSMLLIATFIPLFLALGQDLYRCDILQIPNCD